MWELCLDKEMVHIWGQPVLQVGAPLGNSPLAEELGWMKLGGRLSRWRRSILKHKWTNELGELEIAEKDEVQESLRTSAVNFVQMQRGL